MVWYGFLIHFWHFMMFEECLSDVKTPHFGEMKGMCLTVGKRWYKVLRPFSNTFLLMTPIFIPMSSTSECNGAIE